MKGLRRTTKYRELRDRLSLGGPPAEDPIDYERPWQARLGMVAGGLPPSPNADEMRATARRMPVPVDRTGAEVETDGGGNGGNG